MRDLHLILASSSPRRMELLRQLGVAFIADPAAIDESCKPNEAPTDYVQRLAREKAYAVVGRHTMTKKVVLAADTAVVLDNAVLGKPTDEADALRMLACLSGRSHRVFTAVCIVSATAQSATLVQTQVDFVTLSRATREQYVKTQEPWDKAGGYAIQGLGGAFVRAIQGSYSNVVGLPLCETRQLLTDSGIATTLDTPLSHKAEEHG